MKRFFNLILLYSLSAILLFSCAEPETLEKRSLTYPELETVLNSSTSFKLYISSVKEAENRMLTKAKNITKADAKWLNNIFANFSTIEEFKDKSSQSSIDKFILISGIDIENGIDELNQTYDLFAKPLYQNYSFEEEDLTQIILSQSNLLPSLEKSSSGACDTYCTESSNEEYHRVENECEKENGTYCRARAIMAQRYFKRGCMRGCRYE